MLYPLLRLQTDESGNPQLVSARHRSWRPRVLIGRELCVFESVSCRGVAWHELAGFALLQARRLAPYVRTGASAAVRNKTLMLWFWDEQDVNAALAASGRQRSDVSSVAETLMLEIPVRAGELRLRCAHGVDVLTLDGGAITRSRWEGPGSPAATKTRLIGRPWARDLLGGPLESTGPIGGALRLNQWLTGVGVAAAVGCGVHAAYWGGSLLGAQQRLAALQGDAQATIDRMEALAALRKSELLDREWVAAYRRFGGSVQLDALLQALEPALAARSLVLKELEIRNDEARLLVVSSGVDIDLPGTLQELGKIPGVGEVALRDNLDTKQATFTLQSARFRRIGQHQSPGAS